MNGRTLALVSAAVVGIVFVSQSAGQPQQLQPQAPGQLPTEDRSVEVRIGVLEYRIELLEQQNLMLEVGFNEILDWIEASKAKPPANRPAPSGWNRLQEGMSKNQVQAILGRPYSVKSTGSKMNSTTWGFQGGGRVHFLYGKLTSWAPSAE